MRIFIFFLLTLGNAFQLSKVLKSNIKSKIHSGLHASVISQPVVNPVFEESCDVTGITLTRYLVEFVESNPHLVKLESIVLAIQTACKAINSVVETASLTGMTGAQDGGGSINVQGEEQKRLDVVTNEVLKKALRYSGKVGTLASEEEDIPLEVSRVKNKFRDIGLRTTQFKSDVVLNQEGNYVAVFDPLDGSSNVDAGIPTGTIFGIFEEDPTAAEQCLLESDMTECLFNSLQPGTQLKAAGYCLYSSSCFFCLTLGNGINIFTLDRNIGEFILTYPNVQIPKRGKICSFNEANRHVWDKPLQDYVDAIQRGNGETGQAYSSRYIGSMVGDVHRTLLYGGIFGYPATKKNPSGKLRLLYEAAPMSFIMEQAGGLSLTGMKRIMDIKPKDVHQRVPCIMGSPEDVLEMKKYYDNCDDPEIINRCNSRSA